MTCLTFFIRPLCYTFFSGVGGGGKQSEVDLCVYISVVPPPYCGIDVALWGPGTEERHRKVDAGGKKLNKMSFHSAQPSQRSTGRHFVPPLSCFLPST